MHKKVADSLAIIDDDVDFSQMLKHLFDSVCQRVVIFPTAHQFLSSDLSQFFCVLTDVRMPGMSGLQLQHTLIERNIQIPLLFMSAHGDIPMAVRSIKNGAKNFFVKPFDSQVLLDEVSHIKQDAFRQDNFTQQKSAYAQTLSSLTVREHAVFELMLKGHLSKSIAIDLAISKNTVDVHRVNIMKKLGARTLGELIYQYFYFLDGGRDFHAA